MCVCVLNLRLGARERFGVRYVGHSHHAPPTILDMIFSVCVGCGGGSCQDRRAAESRRKQQEGKENVMRMRGLWKWKHGGQRANENAMTLTWRFTI